jgi:aryl-alcohol dehydrogenase-like predicted oxidoreductase
MTDQFKPPRRRLGRTELEVTCLSMGGAGIGSRTEVTDREAVGAVQHALESGVNYVDTSPLYGESQRRVGLALEGKPRSSYVLSTKTGTHPDRRGDYSWDGTMWSVENSLSLLKTDRIDILLVHDPRDEGDIESIFGECGALEALEQLKAQGVIGSIGLGQRSHDWHLRAILSGRFDVILTYNDYHPIRTTALTGGLLELAKQHDVGVINGSPLVHGLLNGRDPIEICALLHRSETDPDVVAAKRLYDWCRAQDVPMLAVVLQFCLRQSLIDCTLTGAKSESEVRENLAAIRDPLPEWVWDGLQETGRE